VTDSAGQEGELRGEIESLRERARRLETLAALAAGIAHEINNPIGGILLAAEAVRGEGREPQETREALDTVVRLANRCKAIVRSVRRFARSQSAPMTPGDLNAVVRRAGAGLAERLRSGACAVELDLGDPLPTIRLVEAGIEQMVENLVSNALEAGAHRIEIRTFRRGDRIVLEVEDDGEGIDPDDIPRAFEPFFTTRREAGGTGLGLALVRGIVIGHGGEISVASRPGAGAIFTVLLPAASGEAEGADGPRSI